MKTAFLLAATVTLQSNAEIIGAGGITYNKPIINNYYYGGGLDPTLEYDYSYDMHPPTGINAVNSNYFSIESSPDKVLMALKMQIYPTDKPYSPISNTCPRTVMSAQHTSKSYIKDYQPWIAQWYQWIDDYTQGYSFCFAEVYSQVIGPNIQLCFLDGAYVLQSVWNGVKIENVMAGFGSNYGSPMVNADLREDVGRWVTWRMEINLGVEGEVKVFRDGVELGKINGKFPGGVSYWKQGIYTQPSEGMTFCTTYPTSLWIKNQELSQNPFSYKPLQVLSTGPTESFSTIDPLSVLGKGDKRLVVLGSSSEKSIPYFVLILFGLLSLGLIHKL